MSFTRLNPSALQAKVVPAFAEASLQYTDALSHSILQDPSCRAWPDLIALGFWLRRSQLTQLLAPYRQLPGFIKPLGAIFHAAPANVDSLFMYSGILSFLCGNTNLIRLSSRSGGSTALLIDKITALASQFPSENARFSLVQSSHDAIELREYIAGCAGRVLWGSDAAIQALRAIPMPASGRELCFAHKFSLALLDAAAVLRASAAQMADLIEKFTRDNLTYQQQACSSAKALCWLGTVEAVKSAQQRFWQAFTSATQAALGSSEHYQALANGQLLAMQVAATVGLKLSPPFVRLQATTLQPDYTALHQGCGLFIEFAVQQLTELDAQLTPQHQTLSVWGVAPTELQHWFTSQLCGIDRLVPVGQALSFSPVWDGVDLILSLSRQVQPFRSSADSVAARHS